MSDPLILWHNKFVNLDVVYNTLVDLVCITHQHTWFETEEMGAGKVPNVRAWSVAWRMTNVVGVDSIPSFVCSGEMWATSWAWPIKHGLDIDVSARGGEFFWQIELDKGGLASNIQPEVYFWHRQSAIELAFYTKLGFHTAKLDVIPTLAHYFQTL